MLVGRRWAAMLLVMLMSGTGAGMVPGSPANAADPVPPSTAPPDPAPRTEVVSGVRATEGAFPWMVKLSVGCAGALTGTRYVLTAAHCVDRTGRDTGITVTAGSVDLRSAATTQVQSRYVHRAPGYRDAEQGNDWAVVELERDLDLPTLPVATSTAHDQGRFTILGWGATSEDGNPRQRYLRTAEVSFVDDSRCARVMRGAGYGFVGPDMLCAGGEAADTCQGDSGGPMVRPDADGRWVQVGIVSWGHGCARRGYPGIYTQVSTFAADIIGASGGTTR